MVDEMPGADWRVMSTEQIAEALDGMCKAWNQMVAINQAFGAHLARSEAIQGEDRARLLEWNRDLCLTNLMVDEAMKRGRPLIGSEAPQ